MHCEESRVTIPLFSQYIVRSTHFHRSVKRDFHYSIIRSVRFFSGLTLIEQRESEKCVIKRFCFFWRNRRKWNDFFSSSSSASSSENKTCLRVFSININFSSKSVTEFSSAFLSTERFISMINLSIFLFIFSKSLSPVIEFEE